MFTGDARRTLTLVFKFAPMKCLSDSFLANLIHCINILRERADRTGVHFPNPGTKNAHPGELKPGPGGQRA